jgi:diguanylate cyclase (GGDEF)-like protein
MMSEIRSSLLKRQLDKSQALDGTTDMDTLVSLVDQAYEEAANDHKMLDHALRSMSQELLETNQDLQKQAAKLHEASQQLAKSLAVAVSTLESTYDGIAVLSENHEVETWNHRLLDMWNIPEESMQLKGTDFFQLFISMVKDKETARKKLEALLNNPEQVVTGEVQLDDDRFLEYYSQPQRMDGRTAGRVWSFRDITERKQAEDKLSWNATHDALTGLPNRFLMTDRLHQAITQAQRNNTCVAVLFCDLDRFKMINDSLGHAVGDSLLKEVARCFSECVRENDTVARMGGDEFVMILHLPGTDPEREIIPVLERILAQFKNPLEIEGGHTLATSTSIGVGLFPKDGTTSEDILKNADSAMYAAKSMGRNNFQFYAADLNIQSTKRVETHTLLQGAVEKGELTLHYQPIVDTATGSVLGSEALLRWLHPKLGLVPPQEFIPLAEETGLIVSIGEWVMREAFKQCLAWKNMGCGDLFVSVNLSAIQIRQKNITDTLEKILEEIPLDPRCIDLEITESMLLENSEQIMKTIQGFKNKGARIVVDDFGTGYSSLAYLKRFPIDKLKIDRSFVNFIRTNPEDVAIVKAIIAMAHSMGMKVVAEGVETREQMDFLAEQLCDQAQGYFLGRPVMAAQFEQTFLSCPSSP